MAGGSKTTRFWWVTNPAEWLFLVMIGGLVYMVISAVVECISAVVEWLAV